jgi:hypothetical protein
MLHQPPRRLWAEIDADHENERGEEGRTQLKAPCNLGNIFQDDVRSETEEDTYYIEISVCVRLLDTSKSAYL